MGSPDARVMGSDSVDTITTHTPPNDRRGNRRDPYWTRPFGKTILRAVPAILILVIWEIIARLLDSTLVPGSVETIIAVFGELTSAETWRALGRSNLTLFLGFVITLLVGIPVGLIMGRLKLVERIVDVWLDLVLIIPMAAMTPLVIMSLGLELPAQVFVVVTFALPFVVINCRAGIREVRSDLVDMANVFGATMPQLWRRVLIPAASPAIWAGVRIGLGRAILGMVIVELLLSAVGMGLLLQFYRSRFMSAQLYAVVLILVAESILLIAGLQKLEQLYAPWNEDKGISDV